MEEEKFYVTQALSESEVFGKLRMLIAENVSGLYNLTVKNSLNHKFYSIKFVVKTKSENYAKLCELLQKNEIILVNCYELLFPSYKISINGDAENCLTVQKELLEILMEYGSVPIKSKLSSDEFIKGSLEIIVTNKDPSNCIKFLEIMRKNKDMEYKITPIAENEL
ncbi:conserved hypothetical protein [Methanococcus maripaludis C5]|uniref:Uncharacterized protein n=1 Tax=Methanococcus maripaludis (strain C5 / ATCC BAA-1333) TaxID=402880 RepID=A4FXR9_METM5|nr:hypothetical protein [Methanococcus maripaludis]ABO35003.1 conserved hypothetical protein [Methanococcus maripaludis C5]